MELMNRINKKSKHFSQIAIENKATEIENHTECCEWLFFYCLLYDIPDCLFGIK